jgi:hypothetical protein
MPDGHVDVVARIKAELEARNVSLVGPCGAFQIVKRVAWELRGEGVRLHLQAGVLRGGPGFILANPPSGYYALTTYRKQHLGR